MVIQSASRVRAARRSSALLQPFGRLRESLGEHLLAGEEPGKKVPAMRSIVGRQAEGEVRAVEPAPAQAGVEVIQCPCGVLPSSGLPLRRSSGQACGPSRAAGVMLVVVPVSSRKTRRSGRSSLCRSRQATRAAATSAHSCSAACAVLMDGPPLTTGAGWRRIRGEDHDQDACRRAGDRSRPEQLWPCRPGHRRRRGVATADDASG